MILVMFTVKQTRSNIVYYRRYLPLGLQLGKHGTNIFIINLVLIGPLQLVITLFDGNKRD